MYMYSIILVMYTCNISFKLHVRRSQNTCTTCSQHTHVRHVQASITNEVIKTSSKHFIGFVVCENLNATI